MVCHTGYMTLAELIAAYRGDTSYERLSKRAADAGYEISAQMIHNFATKPLTNIPRVDKIRAIAAALRVSPRQVLDSAAESVGLTAEPPSADVTNQPQIERLLAVLRHRDPQEVEHLSRVVDTVVRALDTRVPQPASNAHDPDS